MVRTLADMKITSLASLHTLLLHLHTTYDLPHIVITSFSLPPSSSSSSSSSSSTATATAPAAALPDLPAPPKAYLDRLALAADARPWAAYPRLLSVASSFTRPGAPLRTTLAQFPEVPGYFSGVGDLFSALTCAHYLPTTTTTADEPPTTTTTDLAKAAAKALFTTQQILLSTHLKATGSFSSSTQPSTTTTSEAAAAASASAPDDDEASDDEADASDRTRRVRRMRLRELNLIGRRERADIELGGDWPGREVDLLAFAFAAAPSSSSSFSPPFTSSSA